MSEAPRIQELSKFAMFAVNGANTGRRSRLVWSIRDGNPRLTIWTNDPSDKDGKGAITAPMNPETFFMFLNLFEDIIKKDQLNTKMSIDMFTSVWDDKPNNGEPKAPPEKILLSKLFFGKDDKGFVWMSIIAADSDTRPKLKFTFQISDYHKVYKTDGTQLSETEASCIHALATIQAVRGVYLQLVSGFKASVEKTTNSYQNNYSKKPETLKTDTTFEDLTF
jgi:hypothetical protein